jgi:hypothetical protein
MFNGVFSTVRLFSGLAIEDTVTPRSESGVVTITLSRICNAFPIFTINNLVFESEFIKRLVSFAQMGLTIEADDNSAKIKLIIASGFYHSVMSDAIVKAGGPFITLLHSVHLYRMINKSKKSVSLESLWQYQKPAILSNNVHNELRVQTETAWGITATKLAPLIKQAKGLLFEYKGVDKTSLEIIEDEMSNMAVPARANVRPNREVALASDRLCKIYASYYVNN